MLTEKDGPIDLKVEAVDGSVTVPRSVSLFSKSLDETLISAL